MDTWGPQVWVSSRWTWAGEGCPVHDLSSLHFGNCSSAPANGWLTQGHRRAHLASVPKLPFIRNGLLKWNILASRLWV